MSAPGIRPEPPLLPAETIESQRETYGLPSAAGSVADRIAITRIRTRRFLALTCHQSISATRRAVLDVENRIRLMKEERPMALLGVVAGSAFVLGMTLRIWRSRG